MIHTLSQKSRIFCVVDMCLQEVEAAATCAFCPTRTTWPNYEVLDETPVLPAKVQDSCDHAIESPLENTVGFDIRSFNTWRAHLQDAGAYRTHLSNLCQELPVLTRH